MSQIKITYDDFILTLTAEDLAFVHDLHEYMSNNGCKASFEEKKTGLLGSYKHTKTKKSVINLLLKKQGLIVRIYGENIGGYAEFLNALTPSMIGAINGAGECKRLTSGGCSPKCTGYDFTIGNEHYQKCRYNCFEFLVTEESREHIREFVQNELSERIRISENKDV